MPESVKSANRANNDPGFDHQGSWTEWTANWFSFNYFGQPSDWNHRSYSIGPGTSFPPGPSPYEFYLINAPQRPVNWIYVGK